MRTLIIDDERPARRELRRLLAAFPWIDVIGECANIAEAKAAINSSSVALIFLDIQMPGGSGFDLLSELEEVPQVIFTTAYHEHAVRAFEVDALDYLLKPIEPARLAGALARVRPTFNESDPLAPRAAPLHRLFVQNGPHCWFVPLEEVRLLTSEGNCVRLSWGSRRPLVGRSLASLEQRLDPTSFFRASRRQIINLGFIDQIEPGVNGRLHVVLRGGPDVEISRRQSSLFKAQSGS
jgi:two-component system LytT family response regulator